MHSRAIEIRSPELTSMSNSRGGWVRAHVVGQADQVVGGLAHGAHHHHHLVPGAAGPGHVVGDGPDPVGVADRGPAELLHDQGHRLDAIRPRAGHPTARPRRRAPGHRAVRPGDTAGAGRVGCRPVPSEKRARQRAGREAKMAAQAKVAAAPLAAAQRRHHRRDRGRGRGRLDLPDHHATPTTRRQSTTTTTATAPPPRPAPHHHDRRATTHVDADRPRRRPTPPRWPPAARPARRHRLNNLVNHWTSAPPMTIDTVQDLHGHRQDDGRAPSPSPSTPRRPPRRSTTSSSWPSRATTTASSSTGSSPASWTRPATRPGPGPAAPATPFADEYPAEGVQPASSTRSGRWPWPTPASPTPAAASSSSSPGPRARACRPHYSLFGQVTSGMSVVQQINQQGSRRSGVPPDVTQRILSVTIQPESRRGRPTTPDDPDDPTRGATHDHPRVPAADGSSPKRQKFDAEPPMVHRPGQALHGHHGDLEGDHGHRPRPGRRARRRSTTSSSWPATTTSTGSSSTGSSRASSSRAATPRARAAAAPATGSPTSCPSPGATRSARWPWPTPGPTPTAASSSSSAAPTGPACRRSTPCSARWSPGGDVVAAIDAVGTASGKPNETGDHRVGDHRRGGLRLPA